MFDIWRQDDHTIIISGRLSAAEAEKAQTFFATVDRSATLDCTDLNYISSAGLGILFATQRRLAETGQKIAIRNLSAHLRELFHVAGFHLIFDIDEETG